MILTPPPQSAQPQKLCTANFSSGTLKTPINQTKGSRHERKVQFFLTLFKRPLTPPPLSFEHYVVNFSEGILTRLRKRMSQQLSTK